MSRDALASVVMCAAGSGWRWGVPTTGNCGGGSGAVGKDSVGDYHDGDGRSGGRGVCGGGGRVGASARGQRREAGGVIRRGGVRVAAPSRRPGDVSGRAPDAVVAVVGSCGHHGRPEAGKEELEDV